MDRGCTAISCLCIWHNKKVNCPNQKDSTIQVLKKVLPEYTMGGPGSYSRSSKHCEDGPSCKNCRCKRQSGHLQGVSLTGGAKVGLHSGVHGTDFVLVLSWVNSCIIFHGTSCKPTFAHPHNKCSEALLLHWDETLVSQKRYSEEWGRLLNTWNPIPDLIGVHHHCHYYCYY